MFICLWDKVFLNSITFITLKMRGECACTSPWMVGWVWVSEFMPHNIIYGHMDITWFAYACAQMPHAKCTCRNSRAKCTFWSFQAADHVITWSSKRWAKRMLSVFLSSCRHFFTVCLLAQPSWKYFDSIGSPSLLGYLHHATSNCPWAELQDRRYGVVSIAIITPGFLR